MAEACGPCRLLASMALVYEAAVAEEPGQEMLVLERFHGGRAARSAQELREGLVEELERFVVNTRPASEGSYYDAVAAWRLYWSNCVASPGSGEGFCRLVRDLAAQRMRRALALWGRDWSIDTGRVKRIIEDLTRLHLGQLELEEYLRRHRDHIVAAFLLLHISAPDEYPVFNTMLCSLVCRLTGGKRCSCSRMSHREWLRLYQDYARAVREILSSCGEAVSDVARDTGKTPAKIVDEALYVLYMIEEKKGLEPSWAEAWDTILAEHGCPTDPREAKKTVEEWLEKILRGQA